MSKKFWMAAVAAYVFSMVYGFAVYGGLLAPYLKGVMEGIGRSEMPNWPYCIRPAIIALIMALVYPKGYCGGTAWLEGLRFGVIMAFLLVGASALDFYATLPIAGGTVFVMYVPEFIGICISGAVIGAVYGNVTEGS